MTTYAERQRALIQAHYSRPWPPPSGCADARGVLPYCTAALWLQQNVDAANAQLERVEVSHLTGANCGETDLQWGDLWLGYLIRAYGLFAVGSRHFPGKLTTTAEANLRTQMWLHARRYSKMAHAKGPWDIYGSENHDACTKSFNLLVAQTLKATNPELKYADGSSPATQYATWRDHWSAWFDERGKRGLLVEAGSPSYVGYTVAAILNIYNFADDPVLRKKAEMYLDLLFADFAVTCLVGVKGGAKSRSYPDSGYNGRGDSLTVFAELLFGTPSGQFQSNHTLAIATSGYQPPALVEELVTDPVGRGAYEHVTRVPGIGPSGWDNEHWKVDPAKSIVNYTYVTPDFTIGTAMFPATESHIGPSNQNRWQGVTFATGTDARVYPQATHSSITKTKDAFVSVQKLNALITRKKTNLNNPTQVYFAPTLDLVEEEAGWIFVREGNAYLAMRPVVGTYTWLTPEKNKAAVEASRFIKLSAAAAPMIFEAARSLIPYAQFKTDIIDNPRTYAGGITTYTSRAGTAFTLYDDNRAPLVNGVPVNYAPTTTHKSPYLNENWNTGYVTLVKGTSRVGWDFRNPDVPTKVVV